jgi:DNA (cytosine-5)-methyltransferase 1
MLMRAYYNEFDPYCAQWLRNLINAGHIPPGDVDERSITEVKADEIKDYDQLHFFAGLGGWGYAARLAGIAKASGILTGSPPCQPFSSAGKRQGYADERHLAPVWLDLVAALRPAWVFGEQVAAAIKKDDWLDDLLDALEAEGYATGASVLPACGVGAPHIRQRLWVVARLADRDDAGSQRRSERRDGSDQWTFGKGGLADGVADSHCERHQRERLLLRQAQAGRLPFEALEGAWSGEFVGLDNTTSSRHDGAQPQSKIKTWDETRLRVSGSGCRESQRSSQDETGWDDPDWLYCRDGKWRPVESGTFPLADGISARVGRLRAYGNAIVPQVAAEIIKAAMENSNDSQMARR